MSGTSKKPASKAATSRTGRTQKVSSHSKRGSEATTAPEADQGAHVILEESAIEAAGNLIHSWAEYGFTDRNWLDPKFMPTQILCEVAEIVIKAVQDGATRAHDLRPLFAGNEAARIAYNDCLEGLAVIPDRCENWVKFIHAHYITRRGWELALELQKYAGDTEKRKSILAELLSLEDEVTGKSSSMIVRGVNSYPTETLPEDVLLGNGWIRRGDITTFISTAGAGKSVAVTQAAMCWGLGLPYLGIRPPRPLRIILFSGEDDGVTIGQCREGLLEHSEAITGKRLTAADLAPLDEMLRTEFIREHVGLSFHGHLAGILREEPADLVIINPLLSYLGGEVVGCVSEFIRAGLMPILQAQDCAALIAHHTPKLAKDGWENTDDTYSGIGGAEIANIPRSILTLRPTPSPGLSVVSVSKRQTTGWKDSEGNFSTRFFIARTDNPERPAWIPVDQDEAEELIAESKASGEGKQAGRKATPEKVAEIVTASTSEVARQDLIARTAALCGCGNRTAQDAVKDAERIGLIEPIEKPTGRGGRNAIFYRTGTANQTLPIQ